MNEENFKKGIDELKNIRMTNAEKSRMLGKILETPVESPYVKRASIFAFIYSHQTRAIFAGCLVLAVSFGSAAYSSDESLPGDFLYPIKTNFVEPVLDVVNFEPEQKLVWEEEKVTRRIVEAEKLLEKDELDDEKLGKLERSIEKSSFAFNRAADSVASSTSTSTFSKKEKANNLRQGFRGRIVERRGAFYREDGESKSESSADSMFAAKMVAEVTTLEDKSGNDDDDKVEKIERLKNAAIRVLDEDDDDRDEDYWRADHDNDEDEDRDDDRRN